MKHYLFLLIFPVFLQANAQRTQSFDGINFLWQITSTGVIKIDRSGRTVVEYSNLKFGAPTQIDATDPFRILLFYYNLQMVIVLSSSATEIGAPFYFNQQRTGTVKTICRSKSGGFWVYSETLKKLIRFDNFFVQTGQPIVISNFHQGNELNSMEETNDWIYLGYNNEQLVAVSLYGNRSRVLDIPYDNAFSVVQNEVWAVKGGTFFRYSLSENTIIGKTYTTCSSPPIIFSGDTLCFDRGRFFRVK